jgi:hypothetical protein
MEVTEMMGGEAEVLSSGKWNFAVVLPRRLQ